MGRGRLALLATDWNDPLSGDISLANTKQELVAIIQTKVKHLATLQGLWLTYTEHAATQADSAGCPVIGSNAFPMLFRIGPHVGFARLLVTLRSGFIEYGFVDRPGSVNETLSAVFNRAFSAAGQLEDGSSMTTANSIGVAHLTAIDKLIESLPKPKSLK